MPKRSKCILHKTAKALHFTGRKTSQVGIRKRASPFPKYCEERQRLKRCKKEPQCEKVQNCLRNGFIVWGSVNEPKIFFTEDEAPRWASNHGHMHVKSLLSNGYNAGYVKDIFECNKRPCECAGFEIKDKTIIGTDCCNAFDRLPKGLSKNGLKNRPIQIGSRSPLRGLRAVTCRVYLVV